MQGQATQIIHAYKQAPWRVQRQWIGAFLLVVIGGAMIAARSVSWGRRKIQELLRGYNIQGKTLTWRRTGGPDLHCGDEAARESRGIPPVQPGELTGRSRFFA
jgi:hypothetical protein